MADIEFKTLLPIKLGLLPTMLALTVLGSTPRIAESLPELPDMIDPGGDIGISGSCFVPANGAVETFPSRPMMGMR
jgi:hypothetical protein